MKFRSVVLACTGVALSLGVLATSAEATPLHHKRVVMHRIIKHKMMVRAMHHRMRHH